MTAEELWTLWTDPRSLLLSLDYNTALLTTGVFTSQKLRLFAVICARRVLPLCQHPLSQDAVDAAECSVDAKTNLERQRLKRVRSTVFAAGDWMRTTEGRLARAVVGRNEVAAAIEASWWASFLRGGTSEKTEAERVQQGPFLRCIVGNPFRPVAFAPNWQTETAVALATGIYAERAFDRLPILADALEEAGCDHPDVLSHCRGPGPHARGCWVIDGILGRS